MKKHPTDLFSLCLNLFDAIWLWVKAVYFAFTHFVKLLLQLAYVVFSGSKVMNIGVLLIAAFQVGDIQFTLLAIAEAAQLFGAYAFGKFFNLLQLLHSLLHFKGDGKKFGRCFSLCKYKLSVICVRKVRVRVAVMRFKHRLKAAKRYWRRVFK